MPSIQPLFFAIIGFPMHPQIRQIARSCSDTLRIYMPLNFDWAHMARALDKRRDGVLLAWTWNMRSLQYKIFRSYSSEAVLKSFPAAPTLSWNELAALAGSCTIELINPPLQQFCNLWLRGVLGDKSTTSWTLLTATWNVAFES
ncbi:hypothetical protein D5086_030759 [Populus alba]|uniref:Uncharacterized protein n=1 Tax=Populus alba TaxID=43335 RepID=A0ACC4APC9_POPAL